MLITRSTSGFISLNPGVLRTAILVSHSILKGLNTGNNRIIDLEITPKLNFQSGNCIGIYVPKQNKNEFYPPRLYSIATPQHGETNNPNIIKLVLYRNFIRFISIYLLEFAQTI